MHGIDIEGRIDRVEARPGVRPLLRSTRALTLTAEGQSYIQAARRILADLNDAEQLIADQGAPRCRTGAYVSCRCSAGS